MNLDVTPVFTANYHSTKKIIINRGGTRSSKTRSIAQISLLWLLTGQVTKGLSILSGVWSTVRKYKSTLKATVIRDFEEEIDKQQVAGLLKINRTLNTYEYGKRIVEFIGADDEQKLRGAKRAILYCNEMNELKFRDEFFQLLMRTEFKIFGDFNPDDENIWINTELEQKRAVEKGDVEVIVSTYKDNTFLPKSLIDEIEYLEKTDPEFWKIYGLGQYGKVFGVIYEEPKIIQAIPDTAKMVGYGMDFGFTNDPTALVAVYLQDGELYLRELIYQTGLTNQQIASKLRELGITRADTIIADSAEPKSIQEIYNEGFDIRPCEKGADSIRNGIDILKRYKWNVTSDSPNLLKERRSYKWQEDKTGTTLNKPIDFNNHCFTGDTLITTKYGLKRIDEIDDGDMVLTSQGFKRVLYRFNNGRRLVNNYLMQYETFCISLRSTKEHKVKTIKGWKKISQLESGQITYHNKSSMIKNITFIQMKGTSQEEQLDCILRYGDTITEQYQKDTTSTTSTQIHGIVESSISNLSNRTHTCQDTVKKDLNVTPNLQNHSKKKGLKKQLNGTDQKKVVSGTKNTHQDSSLVIKHTGIEIAKFVAKNIPRKNQGKNSAQIIANQHIGGEVESITKQELVNVERCLSSIDIAQQKLVGVKVGNPQYEYVYDLMVEDCHEYFANGLLVHNCLDALRYLALMKLGKNNSGIYAISSVH